MGRPVGVLCVVLLFTTAGCLGAASPGVGGPDDRQETGELVVGYEAADGREYEPLVREALEFWSAESERRAGIDAGFRLAEPGEAADVRVRFVESVGDCGAAAGDAVAGCAPVPADAGDADRPLEVQVRAGLSADSTARVLKHELGHVLGLDHGEGPADIMRSRVELTAASTPNATARANPWRDEELAVHVDLGAAPADERAAIERQVAAAVDYYAGGADGTVPGNVTFRRVGDPGAADITVEYAPSADCGPGGSCGAVAGVDADGDGADDYHTRLEITLVALDSPAVAWHVGRWLGAGFGQAGDAYPDPLRASAGYDERRSEWWAD